MDLAPIKRTNLLILRGVYPKDFAPVDGIYDKSAVEIEKKVIEPAMVYTEIPKKFTSVESWPQFSNLKCWSCDQLPTSYPKFIPTYPEKDKDGNDICTPYGHFHEWNCATRFIEKEFPREQQWDALELVDLFESKFSGKRRRKIPSAPSKTLMNAYCGKDGITPKQYNKMIEQLNSDYDISSYLLEDFKCSK
jgi:hypothetical protein